MSNITLGVLPFQIKHIYVVHTGLYTMLIYSMLHTIYICMYVYINVKIQLFYIYPKLYRISSLIPYM